MEPTKPTSSDTRIAIVVVLLVCLAAVALIATYYNSTRSPESTAEETPLPEVDPLAVEASNSIDRNGLALNIPDGWGITGAYASPKNTNLTCEKDDCEIYVIGKMGNFTAGASDFTTLPTLGVAPTMPVITISTKSPAVVSMGDFVTADESRQLNWLGETVTGTLSKSAGPSAATIAQLQQTALQFETVAAPEVWAQATVCNAAKFCISASAFSLDPVQNATQMDAFLNLVATTTKK